MMNTSDPNGMHYSNRIGINHPDWDVLIFQHQKHTVQIIIDQQYQRSSIIHVCTLKYSLLKLLTSISLKLRQDDRHGFDTRTSSREFWNDTGH